MKLSVTSSGLPKVNMTNLNLEKVEQRRTCIVAKLEEKRLPYFKQLISKRVFVSVLKDCISYTYLRMSVVMDCGLQTTPIGQ